MQNRLLRMGDGTSAGGKIKETQRGVNDQNYKPRVSTAGQSASGRRGKVLASGRSFLSGFRLMFGDLAMRKLFSAFILVLAGYAGVAPASAQSSNVRFVLDFLLQGQQ